MKILKVIAVILYGIWAVAWGLAKILWSLFEQGCKWVDKKLYDLLDGWV